MKEIKNTIEGVELNRQRRSGNSTRQINFAVDNLFKGYRVEIRDHWELGKNRMANEGLFKRVLRRLRTEHALDWPGPDKDLLVDRSNLTIELV